MPAEAVALPLAVGDPRYRVPARSGPGFKGGPRIIPLERGRMVSHTLSRADDTLLIREAQRGNRAAFEELVRQYDQPVLDRKSTRLNSSHIQKSRMPSSA